MEFDAAGARFKRCTSVDGAMASKKATAKKSGTKKASPKKPARPGPRAAKADGDTAEVASEPIDATELIDARIKGLPDWRGGALSRMRRLIREAVPGVVEEVKWRKPSNPMGVPVWSHEGILCTGETYKDRVKLTFAKGASLKDPAGLFNSSLEGSTRRAIDLHEGDEIDETAFKALVRDAAALNASSARR